VTKVRKHRVHCLFFDEWLLGPFSNGSFYGVLVQTRVVAMDG
jgi:hypothetical protein